jgi:hypothetical protein
VVAELKTVRETMSMVIVRVCVERMKKLSTDALKMMISAAELVGGKVSETYL